MQNDLLGMIVIQIICFSHIQQPSWLPGHVSEHSVLNCLEISDPAVFFFKKLFQSAGVQLNVLMRYTIKYLIKEVDVAPV